jgi:hypothetical protein
MRECGSVGNRYVPEGNGEPPRENARPLKGTLIGMRRMERMPYVFGSEPLKNILVLRFYGDVKPTEHLQALNDLVRKCRDQHFRKILIDSREPSKPLTATCRQTFDSTIADCNPSHTVRVAYLYGNAHLRDLPEHNGRKRPSIQSFLFDDPEEARRWLTLDD